MKKAHIKNHVPVVVTQEDVDEYGSVEFAVNGSGSGKGLQQFEQNPFYRIQCYRI